MRSQSAFFLCAVYCIPIILLLLTMVQYTPGNQDRVMKAG